MEFITVKAKISGFYDLSNKVSSTEPVASTLSNGKDAIMYFADDVIVDGVGIQMPPQFAPASLVDELAIGMDYIITMKSPS